MATLTYTISTQPFYDSIHQCYKTIIVIDRKPNGPLSNIVKTLQTPKLSPFQQATPCTPIKNCVQALYYPENKNELMLIDDLPILFTFLISNGYIIDSKLTNMLNHTQVNLLNKLICFITYNS